VQSVGGDQRSFRDEGRMQSPTQVPRVLITREEPGPLAEAIARAGGSPIALPLLVTRWLPFELPAGRDLDSYDWVTFTSVRALEAVSRAARERGWSWPPESRAAAVGDRTADELQAQGWMPECISESSTSRGLLQCLSQHGLLGARVLCPSSAIADATLPTGLRAAGADVDVVHVYTTENTWAQAPEKLPLLARELESALRRGAVVTCASPSAVRALLDLAAAGSFLDRLRAARCVALGPTTAGAARDLGLRCVEPDGTSLACMARKAVEIALAN
jgi:uroporphyrinogen-III synthase